VTIVLIILVLIVGYQVWGIVSDLVANSFCLTDEEIRKFTSDTLNPEDRARVIAYLGQCEKCQERLHKGFGMN
jgi:hypothetical protein